MMPARCVADILLPNWRIHSADVKYCSAPHLGPGKAASRSPPGVGAELIYGPPVQVGDDVGYLTAFSGEVLVQPE